MRPFHILTNPFPNMPRINMILRLPKRRKWQFSPSISKHSGTSQVGCCSNIWANLCQFLYLQHVDDIAVSHSPTLRLHYWHYAVMGRSCTNHSKSAAISTFVLLLMELRTNVTSNGLQIEFYKTSPGLETSTWKPTKVAGKICSEVSRGQWLHSQSFGVLFQLRAEDGYQNSQDEVGTDLGKARHLISNVEAATVVEVPLSSYYL